MALLESFRRADIKAQKSFRDHELDPATTNTLFESVADSLKTGAFSLHSVGKNGAEQVGGWFRSVASYVTGRSSTPPPDLPREVVTPHSDSMSTINEGANEGVESSAPSGVERSKLSGVYRVDYQKYPISGYVKLPSVLRPFVQLPYLDHVVVVAKPSGDVSGGLENYREAVSKDERRGAPIFAVIDAPGKTIHDKGYLWIELPLADIFKLDVSQMKSIDDYLKLLSKKGRWNFKDRQKKFAQGMTCEYVPLQVGDKEMCDTLWPLYKSTGERNGFTVLTEEEFYDFHMRTPDLTVMLIRDKDTGALVTFCTGVRAGDTLMPMWCGTDYENEKSRACSSYFNMLYEYVKVGIADPDIHWVDLGASRRSAKTAIGFTGYPVSIYIRCKNSVQEALYSQMMASYFRKEELINDP